MLLITSIVAMTACAPKDVSIKIDYDSDYDEVEFAREVAQVKSDNVNFATDGVCNFDIYYPIQIDDISIVDEKVEQKDRYKVELKNTVLFFADAIKKVVGDEIGVFATSENIGKGIVLKLESNIQGVEKQGYKLKIEQGLITISAIEIQGLSNGAYSFLEDYLGCMFVSQDFDYLPRLATVNLKSEEKIANPDIKWREVYSHESGKRVPEGESGKDYLGWSSKLKLNGTGTDDWGNWCHTFYSYIPPKEYFETHPEYFSEYNGKRAHTYGPVSGQLCLTNEDVYQIISTKLFAAMQQNPDLNYWDVSQMDTWINKGTGCQCKNCKALDKAEDSPMGSLLTFINRLADECAVKFPDNFISTLAYNYSAKPPKNIRPRENVIIKLCLMPGDNASDYKNPTSKQARDANKIVSAWGQIAPHVLIWDYNIDFHNYLMPYPILTPLKANNDFYLENNVYGIFHQMDYDKGGDSAELNAYVFAKLMWDKNTDVEKTVAKYLTVYYKDAAEGMAEYYNNLNSNLYKADKDLYLYSKVWMHSADYLSNKNLDIYLKNFEKAELAAGDDTAVLLRVKKAKVGVLFTIASRFSADKKGRQAALEEMYSTCKVNGIDSLFEGQTEGLNELEDFYNKTLNSIKYTDLIIVGITFGVVALVAGIGTGVYFIVRAKKIKVK